MSQLAIVNEYDADPSGAVAYGAVLHRTLINLGQIINAEPLLHKSGIITTQVTMTDGSVFHIRETIEQLKSEGK